MRRKRAVSPVVAVVLLVAIVVIAVAAVAYIVLNLGAGDSELLIVDVEWTDANADHIYDEVLITIKNTGSAETDFDVTITVKNGAAAAETSTITTGNDGSIDTGKTIDHEVIFVAPGGEADYNTSSQVYSFEIEYADGDRTEDCPSDDELTVLVSEWGTKLWE